MAVQASSPTKTTRPPTRFRWWWLAVGAAVLLVAGVMAFAIFKPIKVLPRMRQAPGFILTDQDGQRLTSEDVRGKVVVYNFLYTGCGSACDPMNATMQEVQRRLGEVDLNGLPVQFVTISFDPEHDTPEQLKAYANSLDADPTRWRFATGDATRLKQIIGTGFEAYYQAQMTRAASSSIPSSSWWTAWDWCAASTNTRSKPPTPTAFCATLAYWRKKCRRRRV